MKPIIAITAGDTNGVGYEVIIKSLLNGYGHKKTDAAINNAIDIRRLLFM